MQREQNEMQSIFTCVWHFRFIYSVNGAVNARMCWRTEHRACWWLDIQACTYLQSLNIVRWWIHYRRAIVSVAWSLCVAGDAKKMGSDRLPSAAEICPCAETFCIFVFLVAFYDSVKAKLGTLIACFAVVPNVVDPNGRYQPYNTIFVIQSVCLQSHVAFTEIFRLKFLSLFFF